MKVVVDGDLVLVRLMSDLDSWRRRTIVEWVTGSDNERVLLNWYGGATSMPTYDSFRIGWRKSGRINPFEFIWRCDRPIDVGYIGFVVGVLHEQSLIWGSSSAHAYSFAFGHFLSFLDRLEALYQYLAFNVQKRQWFV